MRTTIVALLVTIGLVAAGCGSGGSSSSKPLTKAQYQAQLQQISNDIGSQLKTSIGSSKNLKKGDVPKIQDALNSFADKIAAMKPPANVSDLNQQLAAAMKQLSNDLPGIISNLDSAKDPSAAITALFGAKSLQALIKLQSEFKAKGYDISTLLNS